MKRIPVLPVLRSLAVSFTTLPAHLPNGTAGTIWFERFEADSLS